MNPLAMSSVSMLLGYGSDVKTRKLPGRRRITGSFVLAAYRSTRISTFILLIRGKPTF